VIYGQKVRLRAIERADIYRWKMWFDDPETRRFMLRIYTKSHWDGDDFLERVKASETDKVFSIETLDGLHIGTIGLHHIDWISRNAELGIMIGDPAYRDQGYGTDTIRTLVHFAFDTMNLHRLDLRADEANVRGIACYEKCGFRHEGIRREAQFRDGHYHGMVMMGILKADFLAANVGQP
jgi:RimJ/RimL family protein N-acetyltransferase